MFALVDSNGRQLRDYVRRVIDRYSESKVINKTSEDMIHELIARITESQSMREMVDKYAETDMFIVQKIEERGVKIILTVENQLVDNSL